MEDSNLNLMDWLGATFGFQRDNVWNQREHLVFHLANAQMRLQKRPASASVLDAAVLCRFRRSLLSNYTSWCSYLRRKPSPRLRHRCSDENLCRKLLYVSLYLLIWAHPHLGSQMVAVADSPSTPWITNERVPGICFRRTWKITRLGNDNEVSKKEWITVQLTINHSSGSHQTKRWRLPSLRPFTLTKVWPCSSNKLPLGHYARLCMVENLERLGVERYLREEIRRVLDETYRCWLQGEEEIFLDTTTFAMAFQMLRANGYDVSSDLLSQFVEKGHFFNSLSGYLKDKGAALELYKASEMIIHPDELFLERKFLWISNFLKQESSNSAMRADRLGKHISLEMNNTVEFPYCATLERLANRRAMEHFNVDDTRVLKTSYL